MQETPMTASRKGSVQRKTRETSISVDLDLDGSGVAAIDTGIGFFDHMPSTGLARADGYHHQGRRRPAY